MASSKRLGTLLLSIGLSFLVPMARSQENQSPPGFKPVSNDITFKTQRGYDCDYYSLITLDEDLPIYEETSRLRRNRDMIDGAVQIGVITKGTTLRTQWRISDVKTYRVFRKQKGLARKWSKQRLAPVEMCSNEQRTVEYVRAIPEWDMNISATQIYVNEADLRRLVKPSVYY